MGIIAKVISFLDLIYEELSLLFNSSVISGHTAKKTTGAILKTYFCPVAFSCTLTCFDYLPISFKDFVIASIKKSASFL